MPRRAALVRQLTHNAAAAAFPFDVKRSTDEKYRQNSDFPNTKQFVLSFFSLVVYDDPRLVRAGHAVSLFAYLVEFQKYGSLQLLFLPCL